MRKLHRSSRSLRGGMFRAPFLKHILRSHSLLPRVSVLSGHVRKVDVAALMWSPPEVKGFVSDSGLGHNSLQTTLCVGLQGRNGKITLAGCLLAGISRPNKHFAGPVLLHLSPTSATSHRPLLTESCTFQNTVLFSS